MKKLLVLSGPSGVGKSTVESDLVDLFGFTKVISHTTRDPRPGEKNGEDYYFVTTARFMEMVRNGDFMETAEFNGNRYGMHVGYSKILEDGGKVVVVAEPGGLYELRDELGKENVHAVMLFCSDPLDRIGRVVEREGPEHGQDFMLDRVEADNYIASQVLCYDQIALVPHKSDLMRYRAFLSNLAQGANK